MTLFYPDIYSGDAGIVLTGAPAVCAKITEGQSYYNPAYLSFKDGAAKAGALFFAYHALWSANDASWCRAKNLDNVPLMVDFEPLDGSHPVISDCVGFINAYRKQGGIVNLVYLPQEYWSKSVANGGLGSPDLSPLKNLGVSLVSSNYPTGGYSDNGPGWTPYGGMTPVIWQYTDRMAFGGKSVDFNAFKGTVTDLAHLIGAPTPVSPPAVSPGNTIQSGADMTFDEWKNGEISTPRPASMGGPADGNIRMADWVGWTTSVLNGLVSRPAIDVTAVQSAVASGVKEALSDPTIGVAIGKGILAALGVKLP